MNHVDTEPRKQQTSFCSRDRDRSNLSSDSGIRLRGRPHKSWTKFYAHMFMLTVFSKAAAAVPMTWGNWAGVMDQAATALVSATPLNAHDRLCDVDRWSPYSGVRIFEGYLLDPNRVQNTLENGIERSRSSVFVECQLGRLKSWKIGALTPISDEEEDEDDLQSSLRTLVQPVSESEIYTDSETNLEVGSVGLKLDSRGGRDTAMDSSSNSATVCTQKYSSMKVHAPLDPSLQEPCFQITYITNNIGTAQASFSPGYSRALIKSLRSLGVLTRVEAEVTITSSGYDQQNKHQQNQRQKLPLLKHKVARPILAYLNGHLSLLNPVYSTPGIMHRQYPKKPTESFRK